MSTTVEGDLLTDSSDLIVKLYNCLALRPSGLGASLVAAFPEADIYKDRKPMALGSKVAAKADRGVPGTIVVRGRVVCLFGQWRPGPTNAVYAADYPESVPKETRAQRELWFAAALVALEKHMLHSGCKSVAFPYRIGCGFTRGLWPAYERMINDFARRNPQLAVRIVKMTVRALELFKKRKADEKRKAEEDDEGERDTKKTNTV